MATHDYVIDNGTGSAVRADLNSLFKAILTNNSGTTDPSTVISSDAGSKAFSFWADTNSSPAVLKIRNAADDGWIELFQLDGTLTLEDGSASTPALAFRDDLDTGIFSGGANQFQIATGGIERVEFKNDSTIFNDGGADVDFRIEGDTDANLFSLNGGTDKIGIGTASAGLKLHIQDGALASAPTPNSNCDVVIEGTNNTGIQFLSDTQVQLRFGDAASTAAGSIIYQHSDDNFKLNYTTSLTFNSGSGESARIDSSGRVLIGATTEGNESADELTINSSGNTGITLRSGTSANTSLFFSDATSGAAEYAGFIQYQHATDDLKIGTSSTTRFTIDSSGNVGIGQTSPAANLDILRSTNGLGLIVKAGVNSNQSSSVELRNDTGAGKLFLGCFGSAANTFGNILASDAFISAATNLCVNSSNATGTIKFAIGNPVDEKMRLNNNGQFGIGTTSPSSVLDVVSSNALTAEFTSSNSGGGYIEFNFGASGASLGFIGRSGQLVSTGGTADNFAIRSQTQTEFAIDTTVRAKITTNGIETGNRIIQSGANNLIIPLLIDDAINNNFATDCITFQKGSSGSVGAITCTRTAVTYATSSDYRLKENAVTISDGITRLKTLIPRRFNWISDDTNTLVDGFFAHEVTAVPEAVIGTKDQVATEDIDGKNIKKGDPIYQQIDQAKLVPLLVAAVQELITKVETLEAA